MISALVAESKFPVGSSARTNEGLLTKARAMHPLLLPPEADWAGQPRAESDQRKDFTGRCAAARKPLYIIGSSTFPERWFGIEVES
jgi:hypothetical protein